MPPYKKRTYKKKTGPFKKYPVKKMVQAKKKTDLVKLIKSVTLKQSELKYNDAATAKFELYHNAYTGTLHSEFLLNHVISQGDSPSQRNGNQITLSGVKFTMMFGAKADRQNTKFRVIIYKSTAGRSGNAQPYSSLFDNITNNVMIDSMNKGKIQIIKDVKFYPGKVAPNGSGDEITFYKNIWLPIRRKVTYEENTSTTLNASNFRGEMNILIMSYDAYGSLITDNIGYVQMWQRLFYRDL